MFTVRVVNNECLGVNEMQKFVQGTRQVSGWVTLICAVLGPWVMFFIQPGVGMVIGIFSVIACELYFDLRWTTSRWGQLKALVMAAGLAVIEIIYFLLVAGIGHY